MSTSPSPCDRSTSVNERAIWQRDSVSISSSFGSLSDGTSVSAKTRLSWFTCSREAAPTWSPIVRGNFTWRAGSKSGIDGFPEPPASLGLGLTRIQVGSIDADARTATISLTRIKGAGPEKHFPEWWPRRKAFDLTQVRPPDDAVLLTQGRELVVEGADLSGAGDQGGGDP